MSNQVKAWSYSALSLYEQCPAKFKYSKLDKLPEPKGPALERGIDIHAKAERYVRDGGQLPSELRLLKNDFEWLRSKNASVESKFAFDKDWNPVEYFSKDVWVRIVTDAKLVKSPSALVIDHKTGQKRDGYFDQLELYALAMLLMHPDVDEVIPELWYIDSGEIVDDSNGSKIFTRKDLLSLKKKWAKRPKKLFADTRFDPTHNMYCRSCHFRKSNGGPCKF